MFGSMTMKTSLSIDLLAVVWSDVWVRVNDQGAHVMTIRLKHVVFAITMLVLVTVFKKIGLLDIIDSMISDPIPSVEIGR